MSEQCAVCDASRLRSELMNVKGERDRLRAETAALAAKVAALNDECEARRLREIDAREAALEWKDKTEASQAALRAETAAHQATQQERDRLREALRVMWMEFGGKAATALVPGDLIEVRAALSATPAEATLAVPVLPIDAKAEARVERLLRKTPAEAKRRVRDCQSDHPDQMVCARKDGVLCPFDSCDIDDGIYPAEAKGVAQEMGLLACTECDAPPHDGPCKEQP